MILTIFKKLITFLWETLETIVIALAVFVIVYLFLFQPHQVKGSSMYPNFHDGDYLITDKISYRLGTPHYGDVVVFTAPKNKDYDYIKRMIGLPGDTVEICQGKVLLNGRVLPESYLSSALKTPAGTFARECQKITVPDNQYFTLGDNRTGSSDSREWGFIPRSLLIGKARVRYWPLDRAGVLPQIEL